MLDILKSYLKKLTNLSGNNKSLLHLKLSAAQDIDLDEFDFLLNKPSFDIIEQLLAGKSKIALTEIIDSRNDKVNNASRKLKGIQRKDNFIFNERGAKDLYVGYPFVEGKFIDGTPVRCPLLFFPVSLTQENSRWYMELRKDVNIMLNQSFLLAYSYFNKIKINEELLEKTYNEPEKDSQVFRNKLYKYLTGSEITLNFNQDLFTDRLSAFVNYKRTDYEHQYGNGELKLMPYAVMGIYPQAGSYLVPDYEQLLNNQSNDHSLEDFFLTKTLTSTMHGKSGNPNRFLKEVREDQTFTPFHADASQENAIKAVKQGNSIVVQGPPGSGKSQLICNLASDFIARGKKVLIVCQKRAALDVVHQRLNDKSVAEFAALVHDFKNDRKAIYEQINAQIERTEDYEFKNNSLDAIFLERNFLQTSRKIDQIVEELEEFKEALYSTNECGISAKELYLTSDHSQKYIKLRREYEHFDYPEIVRFTRILKSYIPYYLRFSNTDYVWKDRKSFKDFDLLDLREMKELLDAIPQFDTTFQQEMKALLGSSITLEESSWILRRRESMENMLVVIKPKRVFRYFRHLIKFNTDADWLLQKERQIYDVFREGIEDSMEHEQVIPLQEIVERRIGAQKNIFKRIKWLFSDDRKILKSAIEYNLLEYNKKGFKTLRRRIDNRLNFEHFRTRLWEAEWLPDIPESLKLKDYQAWFYNVNQALGALDIAKELRSFSKNYLKLDQLDYETLRKELKEVIKLCQEADIIMAHWRRYFRKSQIVKMCNDPSYVRKLKHWLDVDFDALCEYDKLNAKLSDFHKDTVDKLFDDTDQKTVESITSLFQNSIRIAWINHIETKYPILRAVSSDKISNLETELQEAIKEKQRLCKDILLLKAREQTYRYVEYNRLNNRVTYRELQHQVTKKRKVWPLRKTIEHFHDEIFDLVPCWLASPESVSAMFPLKEIFDLVIFDEASQCFAERGLPSIFRAKQIVIAGDSQQLQPNDLYSVRYEEEEEEHPDLEIDSLLDLSAKFLMQVHLTGHYRSRSLELIDFSNKHFYKGKLRLLPEFKEVNNDKPAIDYLKINGIWEKNQNDAEASKVTELLFGLIDEGNTSIGIVTFNAKQQEHILDKIEECALKDERLIPSDVFVKNIENVQGDERDIIIFSIGYAPSPSGKFAMNFGSLNFEGGENRLNVAITRAKQKIMIVCSILPQQLAVEDTRHDGPKLLKQYLEYAFEVAQGNFTPTPIRSKEYEPEWYLKQHIPRLAEQTDVIKTRFSTELPFCDLVSIHNDDNEYHEVILTDDELYHDAMSIKESHAYLPLSLKQKKWKYRKVYSRQFWGDKQSLMGDIARLVD